MIDRISKALEFASQYGGIDGAHHKQWVIDQMVRALTGCPIVQRKVIGDNGPYTCDDQGESAEYLEWVRQQRDGEDGPHTYDWDEGIAP